MVFDARWLVGDTVRVVRPLRNDGTYPGQPVGALLVRRGSVGVVVDVGTFLQDQVVYAVHFIDEDRIVGCREEELIDASEPWVESHFETRDFVASRKTLTVGGEVVAAAGTHGRVVAVIRTCDPPLYHVHFDSQPGRIFAVPEDALQTLATNAE